jgi:hypothetical protein
VRCTYLFGVPLYDFEIIFFCVEEGLRFIDELACYDDFGFRHGGVCVCGVVVLGAMRGSCGVVRTIVDGLSS